MSHKRSALRTRGEARRKYLLIALSALLVKVVPLENCAYAASPAATGVIVRPPTISGTPPQSATVGKQYVFQPRATVSSGRKLTFSVLYSPWWLKLNTSTGVLQGTPNASTVGTFRNITVSVSDGHSKVTLPAFSITVAAANAASAPNVAHVGSVTVDWLPPTENADASPLTDLAGYHIYYGTSLNSLTHKIDIHSGITRYVFDNLDTGTWYFALTAYNHVGRESGLTRAVSAIIH